MSRRPARVTQTEVENAVRGARAAGLAVAEVRILPDGTIIVSSQPHSEPNDALRDQETIKERLRSARQRMMRE